MSASKVSHCVSPQTTPPHHPWGKHMLLELLSEGLFFWMPARSACVLLLTWIRKGRNRFRSRSQSRLKVVGRWFWVHKIVFTRGLPPPRPPGGVPAAPCAPSLNF